MKKIMFGILFLTVIMISSCSPQMSSNYDLGITSNDCLDLDEDGFGEGCPLGIDCDDNDDSRWYWRPFYLDEDHDSYGSEELVSFECWGNFENSQYPLDEMAFNSLDCEDLNPDINPTAKEICGNGIDENCDGFDLRCSKK